MPQRSGKSDKEVNKITQKNNGVEVNVGSGKRPITRSSSNGEASKATVASKQKKADNSKDELTLSPKAKNRKVNKTDKTKKPTVARKINFNNSDENENVDQENG